MTSRSKNPVRSDGRAMKWTFKRRFRRHAFGWRSQPAIMHIKEAVSDIRRVARDDALLAAEGAVSFLERLSRADGTLELADVGRIEGPLTVRTRVPGDRMHALGASGGARLGHLLQRRGGGSTAPRTRAPTPTRIPALSLSMTPDA